MQAHMQMRAGVFDYIRLYRPRYVLVDVRACTRPGPYIIIMIMMIYVARGSVHGMRRRMIMSMRAHVHPSNSRYRYRSRSKSNSRQRLPRSIAPRHAATLIRGHWTGSVYVACTQSNLTTAIKKRMSRIQMYTH